jgi:hypothetical protein
MDTMVGERLTHHTCAAAVRQERPVRLQVRQDQALQHLRPIQGVMCPQRMLQRSKPACSFSDLLVAEAPTDSQNVSATASNLCRALAAPNSA